MTTRVATLPSGLRVVSAAMPEVRTTTLGVWVDVGARYEAAEINGVSHMLEHMAFKGTERRTAQAIAEEIEAVGGHINAYTSAEHTAYFVRVLEDDLALGLDLLADTLQNSVFDEAELARERAVVIQEIGQVHDTPDDVIFDRFQEAAYPGQPLGRSILGTPQGVAGFDRRTLMSYMAEHYGAGRMVVAAAGAVDHDALVARVGNAFRTLPTRAARPADPARYLGGEYREMRELDQVHFLVGFSGFAYDDPDFYAAQVHATLLGGGMSSRLFQEVRERRGLAYAIHTFTNNYLDGGTYGVYAGTGADQVAELVPVVCAEIVQLRGELPRSEIDRARAQLKAGLLMSLESSMARCEQISRQLLIFGRIIPTEELLARIAAVDEAAIRRVTERLLATPPVVAALGPIQALEPYERVRARLQ
ncbi:MAG: insulinase family protein [Alphaproteobacteria bacterium]|nr:insulinase family protein [Alphaproteobacteria bacterium]